MFEWVQRRTIPHTPEEPRSEPSNSPPYCPTFSKVIFPPLKGPTRGINLVSDFVHVGLSFLHPLRFLCFSSGVGLGTGRERFAW